MAIKLVTLPGANVAAVAIGHAILKKMIAANQFGHKAIEHEGTIVFIKRSKSLELVFPLVPQFKTYNALERWSTRQELKTENYDELLNNLSGIEKIKLLTLEEANDPDNEDGRKILASDFPDLYRVLGAKFEPFYQDLYNTYNNSLDSELLKLYVDNAIATEAEAEIANNIIFQETVEFYNNVGDSLYDQIISQIPEGSIVEDILWDLTRSDFYSFPTYQGNLIMGGTTASLHDFNVPQLIPLWCRKTPDGDYITICEVFLRSNDSDDQVEILNRYTGVSFTNNDDEPAPRYLNTNNSTHSFVVIPTKDLFDLKMIPFSTSAIRNNPAFFPPVEGGDPTNEFDTVTSRHFTLTFNINGDDTGDDFNVYPEVNILEHLDFDLDALFNVAAYYSRYGEGETFFDYANDDPEIFDRGADPLKIFDHGSLPWDQVAQHNDFISGMFWFIPLILNITRDGAHYQGELQYTAGIYNPNAISTVILSEETTLGNFLTIDGFVRVEILDQIYFYDHISVSSLPSDEQLSVKNQSPTFVGTGQSQFAVLDEVLPQYFEGDFLVTEGIDKELRLNVADGGMQENRHLLYGWEYYETQLITKSRSATRVGFAFEGEEEPPSPFDYFLKDTTITRIRTLLDWKNYIFDHNGEEFIVTSGGPTETITISSTGASMSAFKEGIVEELTNWSPAGFHVSVGSYTAKLEPTPGNFVNAYHVGGINYSWEKTLDTSGNLDALTFFAKINTPDKFFVNDAVLNAQNSALPSKEIRETKNSGFGGTVPVAGGIIRTPDFQQRLGERNFYWDRDTRELKEGSTVIRGPIPEENRISLTAGGDEGGAGKTNSYTATMFESNYEYLFGNPIDPSVGTALTVSSPAFTITQVEPVTALQGSGDFLTLILDSLPSHKALQPYDEPTPDPFGLDFDGETIIMRAIDVGVSRAVDSNYPIKWEPTITRAALEDAGYVFINVETKPIYYYRGASLFNATNFSFRAKEDKHDVSIGTANPGDTLEFTNIYELDASGFMESEETKVAFYNRDLQVTFDYHLFYNEFLNARFFIDPVTGIPIADIEFAGIDNITNEARNNLYFNRIPASELSEDDDDE